MADLGFTVNTEELPEAKNMDFSPLPAGKYMVVLTNSRLLPTNDTKTLMTQAGYSDYDAFRKVNKEADGYLALEMDVQTEGFVGRKLFHNLNLINKSQQAQEIAAGQLRQILEAFSMKTFSGKSEDLHGKRMSVDVKVEAGGINKKETAAQGTEVRYPPQNKCVKFSAPGAVVAASTQATGTTGKGAPWAR